MKHLVDVAGDAAVGDAEGVAAGGDDAAGDAGGAGGGAGVGLPPRVALDATVTFIIQIESCTLQQYFF